MEQSLFTRFVRLGVPYVELDAQGRARPRYCLLVEHIYSSFFSVKKVVAAAFLIN